MGIKFSGAQREALLRIVGRALTDGHGAPFVVVDVTASSVTSSCVLKGGARVTHTAGQMLTMASHVQVTSAVLRALGIRGDATQLTSPTLVASGSRIRGILQDAAVNGLPLLDIGQYQGTLTDGQMAAVNVNRFAKGPEHVGARSLTRAVACSLAGIELASGRAPRTWDRFPARREWESLAWTAIQTAVSPAETTGNTAPSVNTTA